MAYKIDICYSSAYSNQRRISTFSPLFLRVGDSGRNNYLPWWQRPFRCAALVSFSHSAVTKLVQYIEILVRIRSSGFPAFWRFITFHLFSVKRFALEWEGTERLARRRKPLHLFAILFPMPLRCFAKARAPRKLGACRCMAPRFGSFFFDHAATAP